MKKIVVGIATCERRKESLPIALSSIKESLKLTGLDYYVFVYDNAKERDEGAKGKFYQQPFHKGAYFFSCDDDLIYHKDYFSYLIKKINERKGKAVVGIHGTTYKFYPVKNYYWDGIQYHFEAKMTNDKFVTMLGTGTLGFDTKLFENFNIFTHLKYKNMVDPQFAIICKNRNIPQLCIRRPRGFIKEIPGSQNDTIWQKAASNCKKQTEMLNSIGRKLINTIKC